MSAPVTQSLHVELSEAQLDELAERVARKLRGAELIDQDSLPTGVTRRVYLNAGRSGALKTRRVGRRIVCTRGDLEAWLATRPPTLRKKAPGAPETAEDAELLAIARKNGAGVR